MMRNAHHTLKRRHDVVSCALRRAWIVVFWRCTTRGDLCTRCSVPSSKPDPSFSAARQRGHPRTQRHPSNLLASSQFHNLKYLIYKADISDDRRFWTFDNLMPLSTIITSSRDERMHAAEPPGYLR